LVDEGNVGAYSALIQASGVPVIAYLQKVDDTSSLHLIESLDSSGDAEESWEDGGLESDPHTGYYIKSALINGNLAIAARSARYQKSLMYYYRY
jgi:hypothetical protein